VRVARSCYTVDETTFAAARETGRYIPGGFVLNEAV
jgi:hypothetical protein